MKLPNRQKTQFSLVYLFIALMVVFGVRSWLRAPRTVDIPMSQFLTLVHEGKVLRVSLGEREIQGILKPGALPAPPAGPGDRLRQLLGAEQGPTVFTTARIPATDDYDVVRDLQNAKVEFSGRIESTFWRDLISWLVPLVLMAGLWLFLMRRMGGGPTPKGVLLVGPPGTGKTLLARAVAGEADVPFFFLSGSEFVEMFVGVGASRVRDLFEQAKEKAPCIVFIDELDAIGKSRAGASGFVGGHDEREQTLNQLLAEMDGFDSSKGVIIMAATNRPEVLDQALLRPGRFDRQIVVDKPDLKGREAILRLHARSVVLAPGVDLGGIAARTPGFAGADLANIVNEAALLAARKGKDAVEMTDFEEAIDREIGGLEKRSRVLSEKERDIVAHHEMGHALVAASVAHADPVHKVTIIPRGVAALGMTYQRPTEERFLMTKSELEDRIAVMLGGRVAEELVYGEVSTGAHNDFERASELARLMVMKYGMSERLGLVTFGERSASFLKTPAAAWSGERDYSEETARMIDEEVRGIIERIHERVRGLLTARKATLIAAAAELKRTETLEGEPLRRLLAGEAVE